MGLRDELDEVLALVNHDLEIMADNYPVQKIGQVCDDLCQNFRVLAGCAVLLNADVVAYHSWSLRSALIRLHYLNRCKQEGYRDAFCATGNNNAIFDAVAAKNSVLALQLAKASSKSWWEGDEYLDDFCLVHFLHQFFSTENYTRDQQIETLDKFESALEGQENPYLDVCRALLGDQQEEFDSAFQGLIEHQEMVLIEESQKFYVDEIVFHVRSRLFTEGIAFLNMADAVGFDTSEEYKYCASLARQPSSVTVDSALTFTSVRDSDV